MTTDEAEPSSFLDLPEHRIAVIDAANWKAVVEESLRLLANDGCVDKQYVDTVMDSIHDGSGMYMDLGSGIVLAHTRPENGARKTALSLCVSRTSVNLGDDPSHPVSQVWGLSAVDTHSHQELMAHFARTVMNPQIRQAINAAQSVADIQTVLKSAD